MKQTHWLLTGSLLLAAMTSATWAQTTLTPKAQYAADSKQAQARYQSDLKLCADESSSSARLQCRRDAKTEYDKAIVAAKAHLTATTPATTATAPQAQASCPDCGKVVAVSVTEKEGEGSAVGMIAGGAAGALLGHQIGGGIGKDIATVAGAVGGAYAGKEIEKRVKTHKVWTVSVQYRDGGKGSFEFKEDPGLVVGDTVKRSGDSIVRY